MHYETRQQVAYITINREKQRNALSVLAIHQLFECLDRAEKDEAIRAVQISGAGEKAFCTGADLGGAVGSEGSNRTAYQQYANLLKRVASFPKPTVARVKGYCLAGGMGLMLACDMVMAQTTSRFGTPEVNVGLFPMMIGALIYRNLLRKSAMEMVLTGRMIEADEAQSLGLITRALPPEELDEATEKLLQTLAGKSPIGLRLGKEAFYAMQDKPFEEALDYLSGKLAEIAATEDAKEGVAAFIEKRQPQFTGR
ncbi:enoyl-CoA hydratase/isomerase family protein [Desulfococcaceae bacterium OttesenSCG-928-F15]|nr:enoyl-CoA hydratase/isomerase family protein [Desulfococcaceae bacterium OttesenSCG-928-F15]